MVTFEPAENFHQDGILKMSSIPSSLDEEMVKKAKKLAMEITEGL